jgi:hypothetical protein
MTCRVISNNEVILNEAHTNNYIFVVDRVPTSFLVSKFSNDDLIKVGATISGIKDPGVIREMNNDVMNLSLYLQAFTLPDLNLDVTDIPTAFATMPIVTGKLNFSALNTNFMNDENYFIWRFFFYWLIAGHNPENYNKRLAVQHFQDFHVNGYLIILNNYREKILEIKFHDMHPQAMGSVDFKDSDAEKVIIPVTWKYSSFYPTNDYVITRV